MIILTLELLKCLILLVSAVNFSKKADSNCSSQ